MLSKIKQGIKCINLLTSDKTDFWSISSISAKTEYNNTNSTIKYAFKEITYSHV